MTDHSLNRQLSIVDWDFIERNDLDPSAIHWYPGSFAPGLPGVLVDLLSTQEEYVFDPFCGVGSTSVAAILRGRHSISCDVNIVGLIAGLSAAGLISILLASQYLYHEIFQDLEVIVGGIDKQGTLVEHSLQLSGAIDIHVNRYGGASLHNVTSQMFDTPSVRRLKDWYHPRTLDELRRLIARLEKLPASRFCQVVGFTMLSAIARSTSSETRSWGHIADNVRPKELVYKDVKQAATAWLRRTRKQLLMLRRVVQAGASQSSFEFHLVDWSSERPNFAINPPSLLLTSPPYGGAIDYGLAQRLSLYLLGYSDEALLKVVDTEIGARRKRFKHDHVALWADEMVKALGSQLEVVRAGGYAAIVLPHKDHGRDVGEIALKEALSETGWKLIFSTDRSVRQSRTRQSWTSIKKETVVIYRKEG